MEWNIDISDIRGAKIEQAKVEAMRKIAEQLEKLTSILQERVKVNSVEKAKPHIVEPEGF